MISLLLTCRPNSKYLAKFVLSYLINTKDLTNVELVVFLSPEDTWNKELLTYFKDKIIFVPDNTGIGRGGSHIFYTEAAKQARGDWLWYVCDDHYLFPNYDEYIQNFINDNKLNSEEVNVIAPAVINSGRISHILSKEVVKRVGFGQHGNVDSYINEMLEYYEIYSGKRQPYAPLHPIMMDFSIQKDLMLAVNRPDFNPVAQVELFKSEFMKDKIREDAKKLCV